MFIRPYANNDVPDLIDLYRHHYARVGEGVVEPVASQQWHRAITDRLFFSRDGLQLGFIDDRLVAALHWVPTPIGPIVSHLISHESVGVDEIVELVHSTMTRVDAHQPWRVGGMAIPLGLAGLVPFGLACGILPTDSSTVQALARCGFEQQASLTEVRFDLDTFRAPINRDFMQLRRTTTFEMIEDVEPNEFHRQGYAAFGGMDDPFTRQHYAIATSHLNANVAKLQIANQQAISTSFYTSLNESLILPATQVLLPPRCYRASPETSETLYTFLLCNLFTRLRDEGFTAVRSVQEDDSTSNRPVTFDTLAGQSTSSFTTWVHHGR